MRLITMVPACISAALCLQGCGWKMMENPIKVQGQVLEAETNKPVEGAFIDIADEKEKLQHVLSTDVLTDREGNFEATYRHIYDRWMWLGFPVYWHTKTPERIYVEASKSGYRARTKQIDYRIMGQEKDKAPPSVMVETILLQKNVSGSRKRRSEE